MGPKASRRSGQDDHRRHQNHADNRQADDRHHGQHPHHRQVEPQRRPTLRSGEIACRSTRGQTLCKKAAPCPTQPPRPRPSTTRSLVSIPPGSPNRYEFKSRLVAARRRLLNDREQHDPSTEEGAQHDADGRVFLGARPASDDRHRTNGQQVRSRARRRKDPAVADCP